MSQPLSCSDILPALKQDFGSLWQCQPRGESIEIITPFSTTTQKFISVFVTQRSEQWIVSDGGWLCEESYYNNTPLIEADDKVQQAIAYYQASFKVAAHEQPDGRIFYFKKCGKSELLSSTVYDVANFVTSTVNALSVPTVEDHVRRRLFRKGANAFMLGTFRDSVKLPYALEDVKAARFNAAVIDSSRLSLVIYVSGSTANYFSTDFKKAIVNFELARKSKFAPQVKAQVALLDDEASGYESGWTRPRRAPARAGRAGLPAPTTTAQRP